MGVIKKAYDSWGSDLVSGAFDLANNYLSAQTSAKGVEAMNAANAAEAQKNRDWMERMSSTAHQREVKDLRDAGLNPILSATGGSGASSPGGSMAVMEDTQVRAAPIRAQMANLAANTAKTIAEARLTEAKTQNEKGNISALGMRGPISGFKKWANNMANKYNNSGIVNSAKRLVKRYTATSGYRGGGASGSW